MHRVLGPVLPGQGRYLLTEGRRLRAAGCSNNSRCCSSGVSQLLHGCAHGSPSEPIVAFMLHVASIFMRPDRTSCMAFKENASYGTFR